MAARSPGIFIVFLLGISGTPPQDSFDFAAGRHLDFRRALLHFMNEFVAVEGVEPTASGRNSPGLISRLRSTSMSLKWATWEAAQFALSSASRPACSASALCVASQSTKIVAFSPRSVRDALPDDGRLPPCTRASVETSRPSGSVFCLWGRAAGIWFAAAGALVSAFCCAANGALARVPEGWAAPQAVPRRRIATCAGKFIVSLSCPLLALVLRCQ